MFVKLFINKSAALLFLVFIIYLTSSLVSQPLLKSFRLESEKVNLQSDDSRPLSNSAVEFLIKNDSVWVGGGKGLDLTLDGGRTWKHFSNEPPFDGEDIAAIDNYKNIIWISLAGSYKTDQGYVPQGKGLVYSSDNGLTWKKIDQPREPDKATVDTLTYGINKIRALAVTTDINNITYDIAVTSKAVWITSFAGGLRKSTNFGQIWERIILPPDHRDAITPNDTLDFDLSPVNRPDYKLRENLNHRVFSIMATDDTTLWVGTASGINKSTDGGVSWKHFTFSNQTKPISGNFVVGFGRNLFRGKEIIWAATVNAIDAREFRAVSLSSDGGASWYTTLRGEFVHNFGFKDSIAYAVSSSGLFRSDDGGVSWATYFNFTDSKSHLRITDPSSYAVGVQKDTIWVATADGLIKSIDSKTNYLGSDWTIFRAYQNSNSSSDVYIYPNPFSPASGVCRVHYRMDGGSTVSIKILNFAMEPVRTLINNASRVVNMQHDEIWDGKDDNGKIVANALYYVRVQIGDNDPAWGKVIVLQ